MINVKMMMKLLLVLFFIPIVCSAQPKGYYFFDDEDIQNIHEAVQTTSGLKDSTAVLLSRLDLSNYGLEKVKALSANPEAAAKELLDYYRKRTSVKHPVDRSLKKSSLGNYASVRDIEIADDALKHIFVGHPAYPPHDYGDDIDWGSRPYFDNEWVWGVNRMYFWTSMSLAYWHTGDEKYAREWVYQLTDWVKKNPLDKVNDQYSGDNFAWRSIEAGIRGYQWTYLFQHFIDSPAFTSEALVAFLNCCYQHANYLMTIYNAGNNWGLMEAEGMAFIAIMFPEFNDAEKWRTEAIRRLNREINHQVCSDGHQRELSIAYHLISINFFSRTLNLATMNNMEDAFPESYRKKNEKMCEVPMKLGLPDGSNAQFGDSWKGKPGDNWILLKDWSAKYNRPDFLYVATEGKEGKKPEETAFAYKESGLYSMRSGWNKDNICLVLKCGRGGGLAHIQPDNGTFELYAGGRHLMPDAGSYVYDSDPVNRAWFRQTKVHQTLTLDGKNTAFAPKHLLWQPGENLDVLVVENLSYPNLTHRRAVFFVDKEYFVIVDEAFGEATGDVHIHFQFAPGEAKFNYKNMTARTIFKDGWNVLVQNVIPKEVKMEEEEGLVSFEYQKKEPRPAFSYRFQKKTKEGVRFVTIVAPYEKKMPKIKVELLGNPEMGSDKIELKVSKNGKSKKIGYSL